MESCVRCVHCGESAIVDDITLGGCAQKVCAECGIVASDDGHFLEPPEVGSVGTTTETDWKFGDQKLPQTMKRAFHLGGEGNILGLKKVAELGGVLGLSDSMVKESKELFTRAYRTTLFLNRLFSIKRILAACSVYFVCRQQGWAVSIRHICELGQCNVYEFGRTLKKMLKELDLVIPSVSVGSLVASILCKAKLGDGVVEITSRLLELCGKGWLLTGRAPQQLVAVVAYIAWQSQDFVSRKKVTVKTFCGQFNLPYTSITHQRLAEVMKLLIELGKNIPWLSEGSLNRKTVALHLQDIMKYQKSLLFDLLRKTSKTDSDSESITEYEYQGQDHSNERKLLPPSCKKRKLEQNSGDHNDYRQTPVDPNHDLDCEEVSEADIPNHKLSEYIRLPDEVEALRAVKSI